MLDVDLTGTFLAEPWYQLWWRKVRPLLDLSSVQGKEGTAEAGPYAASKAAQIALAKGLAEELATTGVTVGTVAPP